MVEQLSQIQNNKTRSLDFLGFPNYYITDSGELFSLHYHKKLKPSVMPKGYHKYLLQQDKKKRAYLAHQLVALAFIENPNNYDTVDHKDNNPHNNTVENLQWLPKSNNSSKSWAEGNHNEQKKSVVQMLDGKIINEYESIQVASREFGVHFSNISRACKTGRKCKGYEWKVI